MSYLLTDTSDDTLIDREYDHLLWALSTAERGNALQCCHAIIVAPTSSSRQVAWAHALVAIEALARQDYAQALHHSLLATNTPYPIHVKVMTCTYLAQLGLGSKELALQGLEDLVQKFPSSSDAWFALGLAYDGCG